ncbi:MAG: DUF2461 domain-containing protein [Deltaproteobacteria bacterium]|nr:DUF2461 domain-containing protein [Deltaproteobacteria bacterium]
MSFTGFPKSTIGFFKELGQNNDKAWFDEHRAVWDEEIAPAMLALCGELQSRLSKQMPKLTFVPRIGGSIYRLNRDIRFSKDKSPYKTHVAATMWEGPEKHMSPGVYLHIGPDEVYFGGGLYMFEDAHLDRYRKLVMHERAGDELSRAVAKVQKAGLELGGEKSVRPPRGVPADHPRAELSKHKGMYAGNEHKPGAWLYTSECADRAEEAHKAYAPLHAWLRDELCGG